MSAQKRRNVLVIFGGVAIVLAAALFYISPNFRTDDATGAIGAVQKHRQPQIQQSDVVLGSEEVKKQQQVLYGDFLNDAAKLQSISAQIGSDSQGALASMEAMQADLRSRYIANFDSALAAMEALGGKANLQDLSAQARGQLSAADMQQLSARLASTVEQLGIAEANLASFAENLDNRQAAAQAAALRSAIETENLSSRLRYASDYAIAMSREVGALDAATRALNANRNLGVVSANLQSEAANLEARAVKNMEAAYASDSAMVAAVNRMAAALRAQDSLEAKKMASFAEEMNARAAAGVRSQLAAADSYLAARSNYYASRGNLASFAAHLNNLSESVGSRVAYASAIGDQQNLAAQARALASRAENLNSRQK